MVQLPLYQVHIKENGLSTSAGLLHVHVHCSIVLSSWEMETASAHPISEGQGACSPWVTVQPKKEKELNPVVWDNMGESEKGY